MLGYSTARAFSSFSDACFTARTHTHTPNTARSRGFSDRARGVSPS